MDVGHEGDVFVDEGEGGDVFGHLDLFGGEIVVGPGEDGSFCFEGDGLVGHWDVFGWLVAEWVAQGFPP